MSNPPSIETTGAVTFADCGEEKSHLKLFRVNAGIPIREALNTPRTSSTTQKCYRLKLPWIPGRSVLRSPRITWAKWAKPSLTTFC